VIALWSFWSKPALESGHSAWQSPLHHLLSWALSVETAKKHFSETSLVTDSEGARLLIDGIGLSFTSVSLDLDRIKDRDPRWWALGKLAAYGIQRSPFMHIDSDVYLWNMPGEKMLLAPVIVQNPEVFTVGESWYHPEKFDALKSAGGWVPEEIDWFRSLGPRQKAECCGIMGGSNMDFISYYASSAIRLADGANNRKIWPKIGIDNILVEQYFLSACFEYHRSSPEKRFGELDIGYVFLTADDAFRPEKARDAGYTHLIGGAKKNPALVKKLEARVERDYPLLYDRCVRHARLM